MTTKEEVLRLALESGFDSCIENNDIEHIGVFSDTGFKEGCFMSLTAHIETLIELAKEQGAAEERNKYNDFIERLRQIPMVEPASADTELNDLVEMFDAIRNRERSEE